MNFQKRKKIRLFNHLAFAKQNSTAGFTFVETLVAITILLIAVVAPMSLAQEGISAARLAEDRIVAFYLAQEGIEMVKNIRDGNRLSGNDQLAGLDFCVVDPSSSIQKGCEMDAGDSSFGVLDCGSNICDPIQFYPYSGSGNTGVYGYGLGSYEDTKYVREIRVWYTELDRTEARVQVVMDWVSNNQPQQYVVENVLKDW